jgi:hypothetical protein
MSNRETSRLISNLWLKCPLELIDLIIEYTQDWFTYVGKFKGIVVGKIGENFVIEHCGHDLYLVDPNGEKLVTISQNSKCLVRGNYVALVPYGMEDPIIIYLIPTHDHDWKPIKSYEIMKYPAPGGWIYNDLVKKADELLRLLLKRDGIEPVRMDEPDEDTMLRNVYDVEYNFWSWTKHKSPYITIEPDNDMTLNRKFCSTGCAVVEFKVGEDIIVLFHKNKDKCDNSIKIFRQHFPDHVYIFIITSERLSAHCCEKKRAHVLQSYEIEWHNRTRFRPAMIGNLVSIHEKNSDYHVFEFLV